MDIFYSKQVQTKVTCSNRLREVAFRVVQKVFQNSRTEWRGWERGIMQEGDTPR